MTTNPNDPDILDMELDEEILDEDLDMLDAEELDGEWDESAEEEAQPAQKPKKKFSLFTIIIIGVAVLAGLGILASMGKSNNAPNTQPGAQTALTPPPPADPVDPNSLQAMQDAAPTPEAPSQVPADPVLASQSQGFMNDPSQLDQSGTPSLPEAPSMTGFANAPQAPGATETPSNTNLPNIDQIKKAELPLPGATAAPVPAPAEPTPAAPVAAIPEAPAATPAPVAAQPVPVAATNDIASKLDKMMSRMDVLEKKIDQKQAVPAVASTSSNRDIEELKTAVTRLEERVSKLSQSPVQTTSSVPSYEDEPSKVIVKKAVPKPKKKKIRDEDAAWSPSKSTSSSSTSSNWELRSARSGEAMIAKDGGGLQTVRVGDNVPGLGQIQSISEMGGNWVVRGTNGSVSQ